MTQLDVSLQLVHEEYVDKNPCHPSTSKALRNLSSVYLYKVLFSVTFKLTYLNLNAQIVLLEKRQFLEIIMLMDFEGVVFRKIVKLKKYFGLSIIT